MKKTSIQPVPAAPAPERGAAVKPIRRIRIARMPLSGRPHLIVPAKAT